jgi:hypothetical protein
VDGAEPGRGVAPEHAKEHLDSGDEEEDTAVTDEGASEERQQHLGGCQDEKQPAEGFVWPERGRAEGACSGKEELDETAAAIRRAS